MAAPADVRMKGFASRSTVDEAIGWLDEQCERVSIETIPIDAAVRRVLAEDVMAPIDVPAFDRSAMDGYAVRAQETNGAGLYNPLSFAVVGQSLAGQPAEVIVQSGQAVRIMTGAPMPDGADAVVPVEETSAEGDRVEITTSVASGKHVGRVGEDIARGTTVLPVGRRLRPQDVGLLASLGIAEILVIQRPQVRILVTGTELAIPGELREPQQIYEANSYILRGLIHRDGGEVESLRRIPDDRQVIRESLTNPGADVILVSGGSSVGSEDHAPSLVAECGHLAIHGIAMRPSSPTGLGHVGEALVFLLPGNPVSCLCAYDFFAGRAIRQLGGRTTDWTYQRSTESATRKITSAVGRTDYCRVRREEDGIAPLAISGASILSSTTRADGFVIIPAESEGIPPTGSVTVFWYDE